ncbi:hypothetical protein EJ994_04165 [Maribacter sp. MJ134]|uniref:hypothetical protein n=1 Tax=Maribacter sp. MJ134 TaxID=2496865 RepID=UPI000F828707|nr:hypothetical protein [Maribacter sp. MJ134]AZQ58036.1 hypothetical protein EJ994_04165 [Maribacter sp. MJ134]
MEYVDSTWEGMGKVTTKFGFLERSRNAILNTGYQYVAFKSRAKKYAYTLKRKLILFYSKS